VPTGTLGITSVIRRAILNSGCLLTEAESAHACWQSAIMPVLHIGLSEPGMVIVDWNAI
jgi:hypothetical protein